MPCECHGDTLVVTERPTPPKQTVFHRHEAGWQLPCGCTGPKFWMSEDKTKAYCDNCGRGWWTMGVKSYAYCVMLDGKPQGRQRFVFNYNPIEFPISG